MFIAQFLMGPRNQMKQILQTEHNVVKNPNWRRQTSWLFTSVAEDFNLGLPRNIQVVVRAGLEPRTAETLTPGTKILVSARLQTWKHISAQ